MSAPWLFTPIIEIVTRSLFSKQQWWSIEIRWVLVVRHSRKRCAWWAHVNARKSEYSFSNWTIVSSARNFGKRFFKFFNVRCYSLSIYPSASDLFRSLTESSAYHAHWSLEAPPTILLTPVSLWEQIYHFYFHPRLSLSLSRTIFSCVMSAHRFRSEDYLTMFYLETRGWSDEEDCGPKRKRSTLLRRYLNPRLNIVPSCFLILGL